MKEGRMKDGRGGIDRVNRRDFIRTSAIASVGLAAQLRAAGAYAHTTGSDRIRVGVIGCGGRGTGAARDCAEADAAVDIVAMGDVFADRLAGARNQLERAVPDRLKVTDDTAFVGLDAYQKVIASEVDLVILATPPAFRPEQLSAAIAAGKHVFTEKPIAVDPVGVRAVYAASDLARQRGLAIVAGTQRRHDPQYVEAMARIHDGAIGEVVAGQVYWNQGGLWKRDRQESWTDTEWQLRNWLYFTWLSGDHVVEQHVHNIDVANWALRANPVRANGVGGRQVRTDPSYGHIYDHFAVELEYPSGARIMSMARQQDGTARFVGEHLIGTLGTSDANSWIRGPRLWEYEGERFNPYVEEHRNLIASIRAGTPLNEGRQVADSTLAAIMAREAAYTGQDVTWDEVLNANLDLVPKDLAFGTMPVPPIPQPGITKLERSTYTHALQGPEATA
jgi:predicted dehydrogenase